MEKFDKRDIIATISNAHQLRHSTNPCMQWKNIDLLHNKRSMQTKQEFKWGDRSGTATKQDIQAQRQQIIQAKSIISATRTRVIIRLRLDCRRRAALEIDRRRQRSLDPPVEENTWRNAMLLDFWENIRFEKINSCYCVACSWVPSWDATRATTEHGRRPKGGCLSLQVFDPSNGVSSFRK